MGTIVLGQSLDSSNRDGENSQSDDNDCPSCPLYNPPSDSKEGHYRFAAVAADAEECSQIGT